MLSSTLVIGDVHSKFELFEGLLRQEGIIDAEGNRVRGNQVTVIQLGDLGDYRFNTIATDAKIATYADKWVDIFLWGNHERPVIGGPSFGGYYPPAPETKQLLLKWRGEGRLLMAYAAEGFLITHAGLHPDALKNTGRLDRKDPARIARWINRKDDKFPHRMDPNTLPMRDNITWFRGGWDPYGGLLWRDSREDLYDGVRQVFGHTSHELAISQEGETGLSYDVDTSKHGSISAIWLPSEEVITYRGDR